MKNLSRVRGGLLPISLLIAVASSGCGGGDGNNNTDMGTPRDMGSPVDNGQADTGPEDQGFDAGPQLDPPQVRVVQAVSDLLSEADVPLRGIRLCIQTPFGVTPQPANADLIPEFDLRQGIPHRAVTPYLAALPMSTVRVYDEALVDDDSPGAPAPAVNCPVSHDGMPGTIQNPTNFDSDCTDDDTPCLFQVAFDPAGLEDGKFYSLIIQGFLDNTNTCGAGIACPTATLRAGVSEDEDESDSVSGSARVRVFHGVHNLFPVDVCYDTDGLAGQTAAPVALQTTVLPGTVSSYMTMPALAAGTGMVFLTLKNPADATTLTGPCALSSTPAGSGLPSNVVPVFFSAANAQTQNPATNVVDGSVFTIFVTGDSRFITPPMTPPDQSPEWANFVGRTPLPLVFFEYDPSAI